MTDEYEPDKIYSCFICHKALEEHHGEWIGRHLVCDECIERHDKANARTIENLRDFIRKEGKKWN